MQSRNVTGQAIGIFTFLGGVSLLLLTFKLAFDLFQRPASDVLGIKPNEPLDPSFAARSAVELVTRVVLLLLMCVVGSVISNRGIRLYQTSIGTVKMPLKIEDAPAEKAPETPA